MDVEIELEIPFHDVDAIRVAWHGHYAKYMEIARCKLMDKVNYSIVEMEESGYVWPVIDMRIRYAHPLIFGQKFKVRATLTEWENRLKVDYVFFDAQTNKRLTKAYTIQVAVEKTSGEMQYASPPILLQKLGVST
ncbi:acyl-CoA thioesterase [Marinomonas sp. RSW2]|uniref:Acyl-CoA thioesterase n=1 Tax=Marinomonas maritima TaxID=2940935 RepID=A0ABT5WDI5_9GAMM|nr:acyl-CoA thioesterase [Marinomonas maritima]MDE8601681.1 acyl-CoA thioesterase [Marinomonas maritima]